MEEEIWKDVPGYEGLYEVSSMGRVKSLARIIDNRRGFYKIKERILKGSLNIRGYPTAVLYSEGLRNVEEIHRIVAFAFLDHISDGHKTVVDHINGVRIDNRVQNIRLVTNRFNLTMGVRKDRTSVSSQYPGVYWHKDNKKWASQITIRGNQKYLGLFENEIDASDAYQKELSKIEFPVK